MSTDLVSILEAAYRLEPNDEDWLTGIAQTMRPFLGGAGVMAWYYDATQRMELRSHGFIGLGAERQFIAKTRRGARMSNGLSLLPVHRAGIPLAFASYVFSGARFRDLAARDNRGVLQVADRSVQILNAADPGGQGCVVACAVAQDKSKSDYGPQIWARVAAHVAAGLRIRRRLDHQSREPAPEAILAPDGTVEHAVGPAKERRALDALRRAALAADRARGSLRRSNPERAIALWQGLVEGRWSLIDNFDKDGRRYLVAHRNDPELGTPRGLSLRERQALAYGALGHSAKLMAYELGLSVGTTSAYLTSAMKKLGLRSRVQLISLGMFLAGPKRRGR